MLRLKPVRVGLTSDCKDSLLPEGEGKFHSRRLKARGLPIPWRGL